MSSARTLVFVPVTVAVVAVLVLLLAGRPSPALAQGNACVEDVQKFCKDVPRGRGNVMKCLQAHQAELSAACQEQIQAAKAQAKEVGQACQGDVQQFCQGVKPGRGALAKCLKAHESELSAACKDELAQARSTRKAPR
jgi:hypothetical protein